MIAAPVLFTNTTGAAQTATYTITPTSGAGCDGAAETIVITVDPEPVIIAGQTKTICSGDNVNLEVLMNPLNMPPGTLFNWPLPVMSDASGQGTTGVNISADPVGSFHITDVLVNSTGAAITATYTITPTQPAPLVGVIV